MIRKLVFGLALACTLSLAACATTSAPSTPAPAPVASLDTVVDTAMLRGDQALYMAETAYAGALSTVQAGVSAGAIKGQRARDLIVLIESADRYRHMAQQAAKIGDEAAQVAAAVQVMAILGQVRDKTK